jgi:hypothetical protein
MNGELEMIRKRVVVAYMTYYTCICLEKLRKTMKPLVTIAVVFAEI